jgi:16S rRNA pseudouridine516 synthase
MRLDKFISHATGLSRELARRAIRGRLVEVNSGITKNAALAVTEADTIVLEGERLELPKARYLMLNKPEGYVCATEDSDHATVLDLVSDMDSSGLAIGGRLDLDSTGLVLLSDDGQWLHRVTAPRHHFPKTYLAQLYQPVDQQLIESFASGVMLHGESKPTKPAFCRALPDNRAEIVISEGRYHQVKRMFAACNNKVLTLHRKQIGAVVLDDTLEPGAYRALTPGEIASFNHER